MQSNSASTTTIPNTTKTIWLISQDESVSNQLSEHNVIPCSFGGMIEGDTPALIIFDPDHHAVKFCVDQIAYYKSECRSVPILVYSCWSDAESVFPLLKAGANGYLIKNSKSPSLEEAVDEAIAGGNPLSSAITALILDSTRRHLPTEVETYNLKTREIDMLQMMSEGFTKKEISEKFNRSIHTIDNHVRKIYLKMAVNNLGEAVGKAFRAGIIS